MGLPVETAGRVVMASVLMVMVYEVMVMVAEVMVQWVLSGVKPVMLGCITTISTHGHHAHHHILWVCSI